MATWLAWLTYMASLADMIFGHQTGLHVRRIREVKSKTPCKDCGRSFPYYVTQFDHRKGETKCFNLSTTTGEVRAYLGGINGHTWEEIVVEMKKCDLVCANCHAERTWGKSHGQT